MGLREAILREAISMDDVKKRLETIEKHMPGEPQIVYDFCRFLAGRLNPQLNAHGFNVAFELALTDARSGVSGFAGESLPHSLRGYPDMVYIGIGMNLPGIAKAVCPEDFADEVEKVYNEIYK